MAFRASKALFLGFPKKDRQSFKQQFIKEAKHIQAALLRAKGMFAQLRCAGAIYRFAVKYTDFDA
jgi:hypothetical protein